MVRITNAYRRAALFAALCCVLLTAMAASALDDTSLFTARVPPNVMFVLDTSGSMNNVVWHPLFGQNLIYNPGLCPNGYVPGDATCTRQYLKYPLCNLAYGQSGFPTGSNDAWSDIGETRYETRDGHSVTISGTLPTGCVATRNVYNDPDVKAAGNRTRWELQYLKWYFSQNVDIDDPDTAGTATILSEILDTANGATSACLLAEPSPPPATYGKYLRSRVTSAQQTLRDVICQSAQVADIRYGLARYATGGDPEGGYVNLGIADYTTTHRTNLINAIEAFEGESWTPLAETLFNVYRYFMSRTSTATAFGKDNTTRFPVYNINTTGTTGGTIPAQPVTHDCQKHFVVYITDGEPTKDRFDNGSTSLLGVSYATFNTNLIGHFNTTATGPDAGDADELPPNVYFAPGLNGSSCSGSGAATEETCGVGLYMDDVAKFMHERDFAPGATFPSAQTIDVYTVGYTTGGVANTMLQKVADVGGGDFFSSNSPDELTTAIINTVNSIIAKSQAFTSAAVPASRTTSGENFYSAYFVPVLDSPFWSGHLKDFDFTGSGEVLTSDGHCAIGVDVTALPPCATTGALRTSANAFWDAATAMPTPPNRKLYVELKDAAFMVQPTAMATSTAAATQVTWFGIVAADNLVLPYSALSPKTTTDMAPALLRFLRGCAFSNSSTCTARVVGASVPDYLGDIFHSNPVVVGSPNSAINEGSYQSFADTYRTRPRVIYAGANDGFLHGFHAGAWDAAQTPPRYDRGTGIELMGIMPYGVRKTIKDYVKFSSGLRTAVNVDGSPVVADVWFNRSGTNMTTYISNAVNKTATQWRTVLIQGLRDGGQHYTALDITDPPATVGTTTTTYPRYMWGFPAEDAISGFNGATTGPGETTYMGNTWSEPVITRVRVKVDGGTDPRGYERWVAIFGGGYNLAGDPNGTAYKLPTDGGYTPKGRAIYMVELATGRVLARKIFNPTATALSAATAEQEGIKEMRYAIPSAPAVFDLDFDGFADVIYIGDLGGNMWKWVIKDPGQDPIHNSLSANNQPSQPDWPFRLWFRGAASTEPPGEQAASSPSWNAAVQEQSFFFPPTGALRKGTLILAFGAGERADPIGVAADLTDGCTIPPATATACANNNHFYVVKDKDPLERVGTMPNRLNGKIVEDCGGTCAGEGDLAQWDATTPPSCATMNSTKLGYYMTARDGEKFVSNSTIFLGTVFTGSFLPNNPSASTCDSKGTAYLYAFDLDCGVGEFPTGPGSDQDDRRFAVGSGLPTRPRISVGDLNQGGGGGGGGGDCPNKVVVVTSDGNIYNRCPDDIPTSGINIRSWRER